LERISTGLTEACCVAAAFVLFGDADCYRMCEIYSNIWIQSSIQQFASYQFFNQFRYAVCNNTKSWLALAMLI